MRVMEVTGPELLTRQEVADTFHVALKTVTRWVEQGKLHKIVTPGGKPRFSRSEVEELLNCELVWRAS